MISYKVIASQPALTNADSSVQKSLSDICIVVIPIESACLAITGISHSLVVLGRLKDEGEQERPYLALAGLLSIRVAFDLSWDACMSS